jgi:hypothetical protein
MYNRSRFIRRYLDKPSIVDCKEDHIKALLCGWLSIVLVKQFKIKLEVNLIYLIYDDLIY